MSFDISRLTFNPWKDYSGVVMEQGRVQTDADWNEWLAEYARRIQAETLDIMGRAVYPATTPDAFKITAKTSGGTNSVYIGCGRMYVDGLLAENHGVPRQAGWDPALDELSGSPQPPPPSPITNPTKYKPHPIDYAHQPYYPESEQLEPIPDSGPFLVYLDVWTRPITYLQDPNLIDSAIGIDTTGRIQTVWQVKWKSFPTGVTWTCATPESEIVYPSASAGLLTTDVVENPVSGPCCLTADTGYTGLENQCYRVEIHDPGTGSDPANPSGATFKWSRENASVQTGVTSIKHATNTAGKPASALIVQSLGRDQVLGFLPGNWIEITDEIHQLNGQPGEMHQIDRVDPSSSTITLTTKTSAFPNGTPDAKNCTRIIRWDQSGKVYESDLTTVWFDLAGSAGVIPVPLEDKVLVLENGITVKFKVHPSGGQFNTGDFWTFAARTDGKLDLPLKDAPPQGVHHHYTKLAIVNFSPLSHTDCRTPWPASIEPSCGCCTCTVGDGVGQHKSIQAAINALPKNGGEVCILPGRYYEEVIVQDRTDVVIRGCGPQTTIASPSLKPPAPESSSGPSIAETGLKAVITVVGSQNVTLSSFCVEAGDEEAGILLDKDGKDETSEASDTDVTIEKLAITASTRPAIVARNVAGLVIDDNHIEMSNEWSPFAAVQVSGREIHLDRNWIGLQKTESRIVLTRTPGGIQIGGPSQDVYIVENEIQGGGQNGITLGSVTSLDRDGNEIAGLHGVIFADQNDCTTAHRLMIPPAEGSGLKRISYVAGGRLVNVQIVRNRISDTGLCGIGPVGFFDLARTAEAIGIANLSITGNEISRTVSEALEPSEQTAGAICLPDVANLIIADNVITDFGEAPGVDGVCGIYLLAGELVDISRNQIRETRDWSSAPSQVTTIDGNRGGIVITIVTPPEFTSTDANLAWSERGSEAPPASARGIVRRSPPDIPLAMPKFEPGLPALRVEHNVVRVATGHALEAAGLGAFSIVNNNLGTGGTVTFEDELTAMTVAILNLGVSLELSSLIGLFSELSNQTASAFGKLASYLAGSNGTVLFSNNICQLEARANGQRGGVSVGIFSLDHILFTNNVCWLDAQEIRDREERCAHFDTFLVAVTVQATSNRFEEALLALEYPVSAVTAGLLTNITSLNLSTFPIIASPNTPANALNVALV